MNPFGKKAAPAPAPKPAPKPAPAVPAGPPKPKMYPVFRKEYSEFFKEYGGTYSDMKQTIDGTGIVYRKKGDSSPSIDPTKWADLYAKVNPGEDYVILTSLYPMYDDVTDPRRPRLVIPMMSKENAAKAAAAGRTSAPVSRRGGKRGNRSTRKKRGVSGSKKAKRIRRRTRKHYTF